MSLDYLQTRVKEALRLSNGNKVRARQQVIAWTYEDPKLLFELTKSHLTGIVAYHIERVASGRADAAPKPKESEKPAAKKEKRKDAFGMEILRAVVGTNTQVFGFEDQGRPGGRQGQVSEGHVNAIRQMAARAKGKPKKP